MKIEFQDLLSGMLRKAGFLLKKEQKKCRKGIISRLCKV